jgi:hypothetical protein
LYYINSLGSHWFVRQKQGFALNPTRIIRRGRSAANYDDESSSDTEELPPAAFCQIVLVSVDWVVLVFDLAFERFLFFGTGGVAQLAAAGINVLTIDSRGHGESGGTEGGRKSWPPDQHALAGNPA